MTEQPPPEESPTAPPAAEPPAPAAPLAPSPGALDLDEPKPGLLQKFNPLNLFKQQTPKRWLKEGTGLMENKNYAQATIAFNKALSLDKDCAEAHAGLGAVFSKKGGRSNLEAALKHYEEAILRNPFLEQCFAVSARIYEKLGMRKEATLQRKKMVIVKTLAMDAKNPIANNNMGILMLQQKQVGQAISFFEKSIQANPRYDVAYRNYASTFYQLAAAESDPKKRADYLERAMVQITKALEVIEVAASLLVKSKVLMLQERYEEALAACEQAEGMEEGNKNVYAVKKQVLERMNRIGDAQEAFDKFKLYSGE